MATKEQLDNLADENPWLRQYSGSMSAGELDSLFSDTYELAAQLFASNQRLKQRIEAQAEFHEKAATYDVKQYRPIHSAVAQALRNMLGAADDAAKEQKP